MAGLVLDNFNPDWVWYASGILCFMAVIGFILLNRATQARFASEPAKQPVVATSQTS